jgi:SWI/SNF-related matrix-associated actin-dependent regulator of chromatin subfamily A member 5
MRNDKKSYSNNTNANYDYTDEEDKFLAYALFKYGYGAWDLIRNEIRNSERFLFNWIVKTRTI